MRKLNVLILTFCFAFMFPMIARASERTDIFKNVSKVMVEVMTDNQNAVTMVLLKNNGDYRIKSIYLDELFVGKKITIKTDVPSGKLPWVKAVGWEDFSDGMNIKYESIVIHVRSLDDLVLH